MRLAFWVNDVTDIKATQTTAMLIASAAARDHEVWVCGVTDLSLDARGRVVARARRAHAPLDQAGLWAMAQRPPVEVDLIGCDAVMIRTNPGRDRQHAVYHDEALGLAEVLQRRDVVVLNDPAGLRRCKSKLFLAGLPPKVRPRTIVSGDMTLLAQFVDEASGPCVAKPLVGTRGEGVFKLSRDDSNVQAILSLLSQDGPVLVQDYIPGAEHGDMRLVVLEGKPLVMGEHMACVRRVPQEGEWRSNIHLGGKAQPGKPTREQLAVAELLGSRLLAEGIMLAGLDLIGTRAVELNVYSTGGLRDANRFAELDFTQPILDAVERRVAAPTVRTGE